MIGYPTRNGLHSLPCIKIVDSDNLYYEFDEMAFVFVDN